MAMRFHSLTAAALHGDYHGIEDAFFGRSGDALEFARLRAVTHNLNTESATDDEGRSAAGFGI